MIVWLFNDTVCLRVVSGDSNVSDVVLFFDILKCCYPWFTIIGDDFDDCTPSAENVLIQPVSEGL